MYDDMFKGRQSSELENYRNLSDEQLEQEIDANCKKLIEDDYFQGGHNSKQYKTRINNLNKEKERRKKNNENLLG